MDIKIKVAIKLLNDARDLIEYAAKEQGNALDREDLLDAAEDLGPIIGTLESFGGRE